MSFQTCSRSVPTPRQRRRAQRYQYRNEITYMATLQDIQDSVDEDHDHDEMEEIDHERRVPPVSAVCPPTPPATPSTSPAPKPSLKNAIALLRKKDQRRVPPVSAVCPPTPPATPSTSPPPRPSLKNAIALLRKKDHERRVPPVSAVCPPTPPATPSTSPPPRPSLKNAIALLRKKSETNNNASTTTTTTTPTPTPPAKPVRTPPVGKLRRKSSVSDFNEHMNEREHDKPFDILNLRNLTFDPYSNAYYYWMAVVSFALVYNFVTVILRIAFAETRDIKIFVFLDYLTDILYLIDIAVHYRTAYLQDGILVTDHKLLRVHYQKQPEFSRDIIATTPVGFIYSLLKRIASWTFLDDANLTQSDALLLMVRLIRLVKYRDLVEFFSLMDGRTTNPNLARAFKLFLYLWIVIHWVACFYYLMSLYEGLGLNDWVYTNDSDSQYFAKKYIRCAYWSMMTLTTIGGDSPPDTDLEHVFTGITFLIGVFVFAAVVGNVGDVISSMNAARQDFIARMDQIKFYMNHRHVSGVLQNRVKRWADYSWARTQAIDESELLQMLPDRLRTEVAISVHLDTLRKVTIFEECEEGLLHELVLKLRPQIYSPGDYICRIGEIGREMYIINHGKVEILVANAVDSSKPTVVATLSAGNYFGEISLLKMGDGGMNRRTADVRSLGYAELLRLSRKDLTSALLEYPEAKEILENIARKRMQETQQVRRTSAIERPNLASLITTSTTNTTTTAITPSTASRESDTAVKPRFSFRAVVEKQRKTKLADLVKSDMFQKLITNRGEGMRELKALLCDLKEFDSTCTKEKTTDHVFSCLQGLLKLVYLTGEEVSELKAVLCELKMFDSVCTKEKMDELSKKCVDLQQQLDDRETELQTSRQRIAELELQNKPKNGIKVKRSVSDPIDPMCVGLNDEDHGLIQQRRSRLIRKKSKSCNGLLQHLFPNVAAANLLYNQDSSTSDTSVSGVTDHVLNGTTKKQHKSRHKSGEKHRDKSQGDNCMGDNKLGSLNGDNGDKHGCVNGDNDDKLHELKSDRLSDKPPIDKTNGDKKFDKKRRRNSDVHIHKHRRERKESGGDKHDKTKPKDILKDGTKHKRGRRWSTDCTPMKSVTIPGISINDVMKQQPIDIQPGSSPIYTNGEPASPNPTGSSEWSKLNIETPKSEGDLFCSQLLNVVMNSDDSPNSDISSDVSRSSGSSSDSNSDSESSDELDGLDMDDIYIDSVD